MASIDEIIKREINPFDRVNSRTGNFWGKNQDSGSMVASIHQEAIAEIEEVLNLVTTDNFSRTIFLVGDSGSGKSYVLGRLKRTLNPKAFFAYIGPWVDDQYIWRHILRYTVDSLIQVPDGKQDSQLIIWLKSLSAFTKNTLKKKLFNDNFFDLLLTDRQKFIKHLIEVYQTDSIYNPESFFGVLHDLTNPELYPLACEWLRGDDLSEESMQALNVSNCLDTEDAAKNILANFGKISTATQPIVLCFDQVESIPNWLSNPQAIFNVNTTLHNENIQNFLIIITIVTDPWRQSWKQITQSDKARIDKLVKLKNIDLNQAEALWKYILQTLYEAAKPQPESPIIPLNRQILEKYFPGGKTDPRNALLLGRSEYQKYKTNLIGTGRGVKLDPHAEFQLLWQQEYKKIQEKFPKLSLLSSPELIRMLQVALEALEVQVTPKLISGKYASYSLSYQQPTQGQKIGIVWTEDANMTSFFQVMNACQKTIEQNICQKLLLLRIGNVGTVKLADHKIYSQIFTNTQHIHIIPNVQSVHYLATYNFLVNSVLSQELVIGYKTITLQQLQTLTRKSEVLQNCMLLQDLELFSKSTIIKEVLPVKDFLLNLVKTQAFMGITTLISQAAKQFPDVKETDIQHLIGILCQEKKVKMVNPKAKFEDQLICLIA
ncbi:MULTISPECIES: ATP-binding protein [unclassified Nodularia (in: cyanobacteria)]|uniref:ATP-binding protein n=1 Tax=unclassified Nodularia (in: cyanobacteria) TaxID=2656917 RepID=UPI00188180A2|nr:MULTISPECIES: ATP-binding protein [unclassified Nodularia (in: cyanobacteria)]MBE9200666.1 ATP-binding protein [Nodularia sp. LEGE 06071]MCC2694803.1 ATP-binding protein [Nodularia sp. LEGE 04288]